MLLRSQRAQIAIRFPASGPGGRSLHQRRAVARPMDELNLGCLHWASLVVRAVPATGDVTR